MADAVILSWEMQALHNARLDHIYKLARLLEQNLLTEEEFAQEKRKLLSSTMPPDLMNGGRGYPYRFVGIVFEFVVLWPYSSYSIL